MSNPQRIEIDGATYELVEPKPEPKPKPEPRPVWPGEWVLDGRGMDRQVVAADGAAEVFTRASSPIQHLDFEQWQGVE